MKTKFSTLVLALFFTVLCAGSALAQTSEKMIIQLKTDDFEIAETDISNLQLGEAETIVTESGRTIDLLRTADGVEIYVDGALLEMPEMSGEGMHGGDHTIIHKQIIVECEVDGVDQAEMECADHDMWITDGADGEFSFLHEAGEGHKIIRIHKTHDGDVELENHVEKIIIIKKEISTDDL